MNISRRSRVRLCVALAAGLSASFLEVKLAHAQQNPSDPTINLNANDSTGASSFLGGTTYQWGGSSDSSQVAGLAPAAGYAYVVTGSAAGTGQLRTPTSGNATFAGDSLTIIPYNAQANLYNSSTSIVNAQDKTAGLFLFEGTTGTTVTVNNLVLANGGSIMNAGRTGISLNGNIDLLPASTTLDGITTTVSGGIIDAGPGTASNFVVNSNISGSGLLHILSTGATVVCNVVLNGSNGSFTGGVLLDNTVGSAGSAANPTLVINTPNALGTGILTVGSLNSGGVTTGSGPTFDNLSGAPMTLSTNNAMQLNGPVQFNGTYNLNMGTGTATLGANSTVTVAHGVLSVNSFAGAFALSVSGPSPFGGVLEVPSLSAISTSGFTVGNDGALAFPAVNTTPAQYATYAGNSAFTAGSFIGVDTTGVSGGSYNLSTSLPSGSYGLIKVGSGTLVLSGTANQYQGVTAINQGTVQLGSANALGSTGSVNMGLTSSAAALAYSGTLDLNGFNATVPEPTGGAGDSAVSGSAGVITNTSATPAVMTLVPAQNSVFISNSSYFGNISGNLSVVVNFAAPTSNSSLAEVLNGTNTYTGTTNLASGVLIMPNPPATTSFIFSGGIFSISNSVADPSGLFSQLPNQQYNIIANTTGSNSIKFSSSLNSPGGSLSLGYITSTNNVYSSAGTLILAAANNYSGATTINDGILQIANSAALAGTSGVYVTGFILNNGTQQFSTLQINNSSGVVGLAGATPGGAQIPLTLNGLGVSPVQILYTTGAITKTNHVTGEGYFGALQGVPNGTGTWAGSIMLDGSSSAPITISGGFNNASTGGILRLTGNISGTGPLVLGLNALSTTILGASNSYTGETQLTSAYDKALTVQLGANYGIPANSGLDFANSAGAYGIAQGLSQSFSFGTATFDLNSFNTSTAYITSSTSTMPLSNPMGLNATSNNGLITNSNSSSVSALTVTISSGTTEVFLGSINNGAGTLALTVNGTGGVQQLAGISNYSGPTNIDQSTLQAGSTTGLSPNSTFNLSGFSTSVLDLNNFSSTLGGLGGAANSSVLTYANTTLTIGNNNASTGFAGVISGGAELIKVGRGTLTLSGTNVYTAGTSVTAGTLSIAAPGALPIYSVLNISSGAQVTAAIHTAGLTGAAKNNLFVSSLSLAGTTGSWTGRLDLGNNDLDIQNGNLVQTYNQVAQGYNKGTWNGTSGIVSSAAAADSSHLTALGVIQNSVDQIGGPALYGSLDGQSISNTDVLVKYTYYGDTDLSGAVDGSDYSRIDNAFLNNQNSSNPALTGWYNGDFNYDGVINGSDYTLIDNAYNTQGAQLAAELATPTAQIAGSSGSAVPEPTTLGMLGLGAGALLGRRRRK